MECLLYVYCIDLRELCVSSSVFCALDCSFDQRTMSTPVVIVVFVFRLISDWRRSSSLMALRWRFHNFLSLTPMCSAIGCKKKVVGAKTHTTSGAFLFAHHLLLFFFFFSPLILLCAHLIAFTAHRLSPPSCQLVGYSSLMSFLIFYHINATVYLERRRESVIVCDSPRR